MTQHHEEASEAQQIDGYAANVYERNNPSVGQRLIDGAFWKVVNLIVLRVPHTHNIALIG